MLLCRMSSSSSKLWFSDLVKISNWLQLIVYKIHGLFCMHCSFMSLKWFLAISLVVYIICTTFIHDGTQGLRYTMCYVLQRSLILQ